MSFYDMTKEERKQKYIDIQDSIHKAILSEDLKDMKLLQYEETKRVKDMLIHVLGQISYKKGCLYYVSEQVKSWDNKEIYDLYKEEVIEVHGRYERFSEFTRDYVIAYFEK